MIESEPITSIDVRPIPPRQKHTTIFQTWEALPPGRHFLLVNDHDPLPLYYQFQCEFRGEFHWEYLEQGPDTWRVKISKGDFPDPGFVLQRKNPPPPVSAPVKPVEPLVLDVRPIFDRGDTPCAEIDRAAEALVPGQSLVLLVPFEPVPLYAKLGREGFTHETEQPEPGLWRVEFSRKG